MAMTPCRECGGAISTSARSCPKCGAKVPRTKWWLWVPLGCIALFLGYGFTVPQYQSDARRAREACESLTGGVSKGECDRVHANVLATGEAVADKRLTKSTNGFEAQVNKRLMEEQEKARVTEELQLRQECGESIEERRAEYRRLMSSREYWAASLSLRRCSELLGDQTLKDLVADAEKKQYVMEIEAKSSSREVKNQAIEALLRDYPELGRKYEKLLRK